MSPTSVSWLSHIFETAFPVPAKKIGINCCTTGWQRAGGSSRIQKWPGGLVHSTTEEGAANLQYVEIN